MSNFKESEIKGFIMIDGKKVTYLKPNVKRLNNYDYLDDRIMDHINQDLIRMKKYENFYRKIIGIEDFEN
jgi:hypothetical protein